VGHGAVAGEQGATVGMFERLRRGARPLTSAPPVNFVRSPSENYVEVQELVADPILRCIPEEQRTSSLGEYRPGHVNLTLFLRQQGDVFLSHGLADKRYMWLRDDAGEYLLNRFQAVLVPGPWLRDRLIASRGISLRPEQIHVVGWPRLDTLLEMQRARHAVDLPRADRRPRVLWAPTHDHRKRGPERRSTSSYPEFEQYLPALEEHCDVQVSLHPRNRTDKAPTGSQLVWADYVVSDFGTMVYEAWALGKPVIFPRWILEDRVVTYLPKSAEAHIFRNDIGLHPRSIDELLGLVRTDAPLGTEVHSFMAEYLDPSAHGRSGMRAAAALDVIRRAATELPVPVRA
jgi:hypothetical protein